MDRAGAGPPQRRILRLRAKIMTLASPRWWAYFAGLLLFVAQCGAPWGQDLVPVPPLKAHVTDLTRTLSGQQVASLDESLTAFEHRKGSQIAVLLVPTTQPEAIEQYSIRVAEAWKVGRKNADDGAIIIVAKNDHKVRIEVGYGLEGAIPDVVASRVIREVMAPHFVEADFYGGLRDGAAQLMKLIEGEQLPPPRHSAPQNQYSGLAPLFVVLLVVIVTLGAFLKAVLGRVVGSVATGGIAGLLAMLIAGSIVAAVFAGIVAFFLSLLFGAFGRGFGGGLPGGWGGGPWTGGGWGGGGGWSSGSGGWSGGGGGFGGGGASGNW